MTEFAVHRAREDGSRKKGNDNAGRCLNYLKAKCSFISFPEAMQLPFAVGSVSEFPIISI